MASRQEEPTTVGRRSLTVQPTLSQPEGENSWASGAWDVAGAKFKPLLGHYGQFGKIFQCHTCHYMDYPTPAWPLWPVWRILQCHTCHYMDFPHIFTHLWLLSQWKIKRTVAACPQLSPEEHKMPDHYLWYHHHQQQAEMKLIFKNPPMIKTKYAFLAVMNHIFFILARIS